MLCIAQPPLSKRLQELEDEVGTPLVFRTGRSVEPTEAGRYLYQRASEILRTVEDAKQKTILIANTEKRVLRVGVSYLFQRYFFPIVHQLYVQNPRAEIAISVTDSSHLELLLRKGQIDVALMQRPLADEGFKLIDFPPIGIKALVSTSFAESVADPARLEELGHLPMILMRRVEGKGTFEYILDHLRKSGIHPNVKMHVSDPAVAIEMLESGCEAVVLLPESEVAPSPSGRFMHISVSPSPLMFRPVAARLATSQDLPELEQIILDFLASRRQS